MHFCCKVTVKPRLNQLKLHTKTGDTMKNYIQEWMHGEESSPTKEQVSARVDIALANKIKELSGFFGVNKSSIIEGALDLGLRHLEEEAHQAGIDLVKSNAISQGKEEEFNEMMKGAKDA